MDIKELTVPGALEVTPVVHGDPRGAFFEGFRADRFAQAVGHSFELAQANCSVSAAGAVRGIHFADVPPGQAKWITCPSGALLDVVVDIRVGSPTFGYWDAARLDDENRKVMYVPEGVGHAFMALEDRTVIQYLCSAPYAPGREHGVHALDPDIGIDWPTTGRGGSPLEPLLSERDARAPMLSDAERSGLLPSYDATQAYVASLRG